MYNENRCRKSALHIQVKIRELLVLPYNDTIALRLHASIGLDWYTCLSGD